MASKLTKRELMQPIKATCIKCGGEAWIIPIPQPIGSCLCSKCTFGEQGLTLNDMLIKIFAH